MIESLRIQAPEITFEGSLHGSNLSKILENLEASAGGDQSTKSEKPAAKNEKKFQVREVVVTGGKIKLSMNVLAGRALTVPLPELRLQNVGTADKAVTAAELARQIMKPLLASVTQVVSEAVTNLGKGVKEITKGVEQLGKGAVDKVQKATKELKDLFKK